MANDIVIVGAGVVGLTTALALAKTTSLSIALLDSAEKIPDWHQENYDLRVSALTLASQKLLHKLDVWEAIANKRVAPYKKMFVWDEQQHIPLDFDCQLIFTKQLGWIVEDSLLRAELLQIIKQQQNIQLFSSVKLTSLVNDGNGITLTSPNNTWHAQLVIAADGANSWVRQHAGISISEKNYFQHALVTNVETEYPHNSIAYQRFLSDGPLAFLPLASANQCSIVWTISDSKATQLLNLDEENFKSQLQEAFEFKLGKVIKISERKILPLVSRHAHHYVQDNLALVGDAVHTIHPLAGQGLNLGLQDIACLVDTIKDAINNGRNFASRATLRRYERARKTENAMMLRVVDNMQRIFNREIPNCLLQGIVDRGLELTSNVNFLKKFFIMQAAGGTSR